jgi:adenylate kinase family enzyme
VDNDLRSCRSSGTLLPAPPGAAGENLLVPERIAVLSSAVVRRVSVVGTSGSGKSTLARELAGILGVPHLELDSVHHQPGWVPLPPDEFRQAIAAKVAGDGWVVDGNYSSVRPLVWARADTVVWLDLPKHTVMRQIIWRTLRRVARREELWNGNRERWRNFFSLDPHQSVIAWAWHKHAEYQERYGAAANDPANAHLTFIRLTSRSNMVRFLTGARGRSTFPPLLFCLACSRHVAARSGRSSPFRAIFSRSRFITRRLIMLRLPGRSRM